MYHLTQTSDSISHNSCFENFYYVYTTGLGQVYYHGEVLDNSNSRELIGYVKDGDTIGVITPDPILLSAKKENDLDTTFDLYPNPVSDKLSLYFKNETPSIIQILDLNGRMVKEMEVSNNIEQMEINLEALTSGLYLVKVKYEGFERVKKLIKR